MNRTKKLVLAAVLTAMSIVLLYVPFLRFPIFAAAPFLEYDAMDVPILIAALLMGFKGGICVTLVSCVIQGLTVSSASGIYGIIMHFIATGGFVLGVSLVNKKTNGKKTVLSLVTGVICMVLITIPANLFVTPIFMGVTRQVVFAMLPTVFIPFNLVKASINAAVTFLIFGPVKKAASR